MQILRSQSSGKSLQLVERAPILEGNGAVRMRCMLMSTCAVCCGQEAAYWLVDEHVIQRQTGSSARGWWIALCGRVLIWRLWRVFPAAEQPCEFAAFPAGRSVERVQLQGRQGPRLESVLAPASTHPPLLPMAMQNHQDVCSPRIMFIDACIPPDIYASHVGRLV